VTRVLLVGKGPPATGGLPTVLSMLLDSDLAQRYDLSLCNLSRPDPTPGGRLSLANVARTASDLRKVWRAARGQHVVHLHSAFAPTVTAIRLGLLAGAARLRGARVVVHVHGGRVVSWVADSRLARLVMHVSLRPAHAVLAVSAAVAAVLSDELGPERVAVVPNAVAVRDAPLAHPVRTPPTVLYLGVISPRKGLGELFTASEALLADGLEHELVLAGGNPEEGEAVIARVRESAPRHARFLGPVPHTAVPDLLVGADVLCLPSWVEAAPISVLEAMAAGLPVVASEVGDIPDMVVDGDTGLLVPPRDAIMLQRALARLLADPDLRAAMGTRGRQRVRERYSVAATVQLVDAAYRGGEVTMAAGS
jgi:glycosyltransferase involved in cell wall biosynthesis